MKPEIVPFGIKTGKGSAKVIQASDLVAAVPPKADPRWCCEQLEAGRILYFDKSPFSFVAEDQAFLLAQQQSGSPLHKNISYRPQQDRLRGFAAQHAEDVERLQRILRDYSRQSTELLGRLLTPYAKSAALDFASYRPIEEEGRDLPVHKRNDLMHVDSFPSRPTRGGRILRCFTNINPTQSRVWQTTRPFADVAEQWFRAAGLDRIAREQNSLPRLMARSLGGVKRALGLRAPDHSAYDLCMLRLHDFLKESREFQTDWPQVRLEFPPQSSWLVFTDSVPHAVLSGRCALEQTYIVAESAMLSPEKSPLRVLEAACGCPLVDGQQHQPARRAA